jgi:hypothetical protein
MTIQQSKNVRKITATVPQIAGTIHTQFVQYAVTENYVTGTDVIEMAVLPANCKLTTVDLFTAGIAATATLDVGFLTGEYGDPLDTRTGDSTLLAAAAKNGAASATIGTLAPLAASNVDRGVGVTLSANEAAGAGVITLRLNYTAA